MYVIYGKVGCKACDQAKDLLDFEGYEHEYKILGVHYEVADLYTFAPVSNRSLPMITKNGEYLGGINELRIDVEKGAMM